MVGMRWQSLAQIRSIILKWKELPGIQKDNVREICMNDMEEEDIIYLEDAEEED